MARQAAVPVEIWPEIWCMNNAICIVQDYAARGMTLYAIRQQMADADDMPSAAQAGAFERRGPEWMH